ncbi:LysR family transcriptional regulator [Burkholderia stagnalis]
MEAKVNRFVLMDTFVRIVEMGSFTEAARLLNTSQPTVSRQLQSLESFIGLELINRTTHGMRITEAGRRYYDYARTLISEMMQFENGMRGELVEPRGLLRVAVPHLLAPEWLTAVASCYFEACPLVKLEWVTSEVPARFHEEAIDCVIRFGQPFDQTSEVRQVGVLERIVVASPAFLAQHEFDQSDCASFCRIPWISQSNRYKKNLVLRNGRQERCELKIDPVFAADQALVTREAARQGIGAVLIPERMVRDDIREGRLVRILPEWVGEPIPVNILFAQDMSESLKLAKFIDVAASAIRKILEA